jgi:Ni/Co efflux regulator RcnB
LERLASQPPWPLPNAALLCALTGTIIIAFSTGFFLEPLFYSQSYWIGNPYDYRLPPAPPGTQWVRYYNDVLLVDMYTGEVIDVVYDFFW